MKAGSAKTIAHWLFIVLMVVSAAILATFYLVGFDNSTMIAGSSYTNPEYTDLLMYWMYALLVVSIVCVLLSTIRQFISMCISDPKSAVKGVIYLVLLVALFFGAYALSDDAPVMNNGKAFTDSTILKFTDVCIYVQYVLLTVTAVCTVIALTGVFKAANKIKA